VFEREKAKAVEWAFVGGLLRKPQRNASPLLTAFAASPLYARDVLPLIFDFVWSPTASGLKPDGPSARKRQEAALHD
jgi:hypothetical protein